MSEIKIKAMKNLCFAFLLFGIISIWLSIILEKYINNSELVIK